MTNYFFLFCICWAAGEKHFIFADTEFRVYWLLDQENEFEHGCRVATCSVQELCTYEGITQVDFGFVPIGRGMQKFHACASFMS